MKKLMIILFGIIVTSCASTKSTYMTFAQEERDKPIKTKKYKPSRYTHYTLNANQRDKPKKFKGKIYTF